MRLLETGKPIRFTVREIQDGELFAVNPQTGLQEQLTIGPWEVLLDGEDVSKRCTAADEAAGTVELFVKDANGRAVIENDRPKMETRQGRVQVHYQWERVPAVLAEQAKIGYRVGQRTRIGA
jgi:hypothetical protein